MNGETPPPKADRRHATAVRDLLRRSDFTREGIQGVLGVSGDVLARPLDRAVHLRRLQGTGALETLIRLFLLDEPVAWTVAADALGGPDLEALEALAMVAHVGEEARGTVRLVPHGEIVIASDLPDRDGVHADHVAGLHRPSSTLADLTARRRVRTALDVGTGCGIQALLAARHAERVVATDINGRALAFAELNAALNGIANIEFRQGSFFEPVAGETFELVVCNPPYVISPETAYVFRDSGLGRDRVSERLVGELPGLLDEGGIATIMVSWIQDGDDPAKRPREWLANRGCDAWILHTDIEDPLTAAAGWNRDLAPDQARFDQAIERWLTYFREEGIESLAYGALILRKRPSGLPNWIRSRELPNDDRGYSEEHVVRLFTGPDTSNRLSDEALAAARLSLAEGADIETHLRRTADGWAEAATLSLEAGIPFSAELDRVTAGLLAGLDGSRPLGEVLDGFADAIDAPREKVRASGVRIARELLELGFASLVPGEAAPTSPEPRSEG